MSQKIRCPQCERIGGVIKRVVANIDYLIYDDESLIEKNVSKTGEFVFLCLDCNEKLDYGDLRFKKEITANDLRNSLTEVLAKNSIPIDHLKNLQFLDHYISTHRVEIEKSIKLNME